MRYANHECAKCGVILPANELATVTDDVFSGSTKYQRRSHGTLRPGGRADHYSRRRSRLCTKCLTKRRLGQLAFGSIVAAIVAPALAVPLIGGAILLFMLFAMRRWLGLLVAGTAIALGAVWLMGGHPFALLAGIGSTVAGITSPASKLSPAPATVAMPSQTEEAAADRDRPNYIVPAKQKASTTAPVKPTVQQLPPSRADYPACSAAVTDHCVDR